MVGKFQFSCFLFFPSSSWARASLQLHGWNEGGPWLAGAPSWCSGTEEFREYVHKKLVDHVEIGRASEARIVMENFFYVQNMIHIAHIHHLQLPELLCDQITPFLFHTWTGWVLLSPLSFMDASPFRIMDSSFHLIIIHCFYLCELHEASTVDVLLLCFYCRRCCCCLLLASLSHLALPGIPLVGEVCVQLVQFSITWVDVEVGAASAARKRIEGRGLW